MFREDVGAAIDLEAPAVLLTELAPGEQLMWFDQPREFPWLLALGCLLFVGLIGGLGVWPLGVALFIGDKTILDMVEITVNGERVTSQSPETVLWMAFWGFSLGMVVGAGFFGGIAYLRARQVYGLTDQRAIIIVRPPFFRCTSFELAGAVHLMRIGQGRTGSIKIFPNKPTASGFVLRHAGHWLTLIYAVSDPRRVEALMRTIAQQKSIESTTDEQTHSAV